MTALWCIQTPDTPTECSYQQRMLMHCCSLPLLATDIVNRTMVAIMLRTWSRATGREMQ